MDTNLPVSQLERDLKARDVSNWLAAVINVLQDQYRRPNYTELMKRVDIIDTQIPQVKRALMYLINTEGK